MVPKELYKGKITIGIVQLVFGNVRHSIPVIMELESELEEKIDSAYFSKAPFNGVDIIIEYGDNENYLQKAIDAPNLQQNSDDFSNRSDSTYLGVNLIN